MQGNPIAADYEWTWSAERFEALEVLKQGESKDIRVLDDDHVIVKLRPTVYSFSSNRSAVISGTDTARLRSFEILTSVLKTAGIETTTVAFGDDYYISRRMKRHGVDYCPPLEVVVKARHVGTPKHSLYEIESFETLDGSHIQPEKPHPPYVRFDFTNPLQDRTGKRLKDECIPTGLANRYLDAEKAEQTAMRSFEALFVFLSARGIRLDDICFKIDHTGHAIFGEVSPDCMRAVLVGDQSDFFSAKGVDTSKDSFRKGASLEDTLAKYERFADLISAAPTHAPVPVYSTVKSTM